MSLKNDVLSGLKWSVIAKLVTQLFSWVSTFLVIRWLTPHDYGVMGISMIFVSFISMLATSGITNVLVRESNPSLMLKKQMFTLSVLFNAGLSLLIALATPWIADIYNSPEIKAILWVMCVVNLSVSFTVVPLSTLQREMRFKEKALAESISGLSAAVVSCALAYFGFGYYALVAGVISMLLLKALLLNIMAAERYSLTFQFQNMGEVFSYTVRTQVGSIIWYLYSSADALIIGKMLGVEKSGVYSTASEIANIPLQKFSSIINEVSFAAFSKVKDNLQRAVHLASQAATMIAVVMSPVFYGIASISSEFVFVILGPKWMPAAAIIPILCISIPIRVVISVWLNFVFAMGDSKFGLKTITYTAIIVPSAVFCGALTGELTTTAYYWLCATLLCMTVTLYRIKLKFSATIHQMFVFALPVAVSAFMWFINSQLDKLFTGMQWDHSSAVMDVLGVMLMKILVGFLVASSILIPIYWKLFRDVLKKDT